MYNALIILGIRYCTLEGEIFGIIRRVPVIKFISNPIYGCVVCMSSVWGISYWYYAELSYQPIEYIISLAGLMYAISWIMDFLSR